MDIQQPAKRSENPELVTDVFYSWGLFVLACLLALGTPASPSFLVASMLALIASIMLYNRYRDVT